MPKEPTSPSSVILYQTEDGQTRVQCRFENETIWLTQALMAELFQTTPQNITLHLKAIYADGELSEGATCKHYLQVRTEGGRDVQREVKHYSLEAILAVGYRVRSLRGTQFRQWATARLQEYLVKGFALDDERLKRAGDGNYFEELLARLRDIRSSEKVFWRKVLEIYATSIDYDPGVEMTQRFFQTVQNKMHWAVHGQTAAEVIQSRADASKPQMGLTSWLGPRPRKADVGVAKNYLGPRELEALNRIVTAYLEFAELRAMERRPMFMRDWIARLDDFLRLSERELLTHAGKLSHETALAKAEAEYERFRLREANQPSAVEADFSKAVKHLEEEAKKLARPGSKKKLK